MNFFEWIKGSLDNSPGGASSKKLSAFWTLVVIITPIILVWTIWAYNHDDWAMLVPVLTIMVTFAATALSINAYEKVKGKAGEEPKQE